VGVPYEVTTQFTSSVVTRGDGSGAEVDFAPGNPVLPGFVAGAPLPEPATVVLLGLGTVAFAWRRRRAD
jgi:hypothetical protein